ncbi:MAG: hypothetical protein KF758_12345 [Anaerolineales bacterium]|nr:hypothetical protein [Anaerolineales bacterium]
MKSALKSLHFIIIVSLVACSTDEALPPPPLFISEREVSNSRSFINLSIDEIMILGDVGDIAGSGEFRLLIIGADTSGKSSGTYCPGDDPISIQKGDTITSPCLFTISFDEKKVADGVFLMLIAIDEDESSLSADLTYELIANKLGESLGQAVAKGILGVATKSNPYTLATQVLVSFLGGKVKNWIEEAETIGTQGIFLSRNDNWSAGIETTVTSNDGGMRIVYTVSRSLSNESEIYPTATLKPQPTNTLLPTNTPLPTAIIPRIYDFSACTKQPCNKSNAITTFKAGTDTIYISWKYENISYGSHYIRYWTHERKGRWMTYECSWDRNSSGEINMKLFETGGPLASGKWTVTMVVNDEVILQESLTIVGNENFWAPVPPRYFCFE